MSRPPLEDRSRVRSLRWLVRVTEPERLAVEEAAALEGRSVSDFLRAAAAARVRAVRQRFPSGRRRRARA